MLPITVCLGASCGDGLRHTLIGTEDEYKNIWFDFEKSYELGTYNICFKEFKYVKNSSKIDFGATLPRHYITFYTGECNTDFMQQIIR